MGWEGSAVRIRMKMDMEEANAKQRWGRKKEDERADMTEEEKKIDDEEDIRRRQIYDMEENTLDYAKLRVTDTGRNRRTVLPKERSVEEESLMEVRKNVWMEVFDKEGYREKGMKHVG